MSLADLRQSLKALADSDKAAHAQRFFKTGPGQYGEGDRFLGIRVPELRALAKHHRDLPLSAVRTLLRSPWHEERFIALMLLVQMYRKGEDADKTRYYDFYLQYADRINNWDFVDVSVEHIIGDYLWPRDRSPLYVLMQSGSLWERRMAIIATFCFIRRNEFDDTLRIAEGLLNDEHDLIHKAVGWMLREVGKREQKVLETFLDEHSAHMPRTMLRYAIERLPEGKRRAYMMR